jgi:hypothetical protein
MLFFFSIVETYSSSIDHQMSNVTSTLHTGRDTLQTAIKKRKTILVLTAAGKRNCTLGVSSSKRLALHVLQQRALLFDGDLSGWGLSTRCFDGYS